MITGLQTIEQKLAIDAFFAYYENQFIVTWRTGERSHVSEPMLRNEANKLRDELVDSKGAFDIIVAKVMRD